MKTTKRDKELFESQHYNRKLARPLTFPFSRSFSDPLNGGGFDPDATAYSALLRGDGASVSGSQAAAINDFFVSGKDEGWYSALKRMYLPIWAAAAPNAIDMIGGPSGTWVGGSGVTHAAGYAKGDGSTGRFDFGISPYSLGLTRNTSTIGCLVAVVPTQTGRFVSVQTGGTPLHINMVTSSIIRTNSFDLAVLDGSATSYASAGGVWVLSRTTSTSVKLFQLDDAGSSEDANTATSDNVNITHDLTGMARNNSGSYSAYSDAGFGAFFAATGMTDAQATNFMAATRTLWETATGLSLP